MRIQSGFITTLAEQWAFAVNEEEERKKRLPSLIEFYHRMGVENGKRFIARKDRNQKHNHNRLKTETL